MLYFAKLNPDKKYYNSVAKFDKSIISKLLYYFLSHGLNFRELENWVLEIDKSGYESMKIIKYFGLNHNHLNLYEGFSKSKIFEFIKKSEHSTDILLNYLSNDFVSDEFDNLLPTNNKYNLDNLKKLFPEYIKADDNIEVELYFNAQMKIRNMTIQSKFRNQLIIEFKSKCAICNIKEKRLLIASHILPYSRSRGDINIAGNSNNGLLLCPIHDSLFESGNFITFDSNSGKIRVDESIEFQLYSEYKISKDLKLNKKFMNPERKKFMFLHNKLFSENSKKVF